MAKTPAPSSSTASDGQQSPQGDLSSLSSRVRRGALWIALSTLLLRFANIAITAVVAHILAPRDFGIFTVALTAYTIVNSLSELGIASCLIRADLDIDVIAPTMVTVSLAMSSIFAGTMALFAGHIATALGSAGGTGAVRVMALVVFISGLTAVPGAQLTRDFKQDKLFLANVISLIPSTAVLLLLAKSGSGAMAFAWSRVIAQLIMGFVMVAYTPKLYRPGISRGALSVLARFGLPLAGANFINYVLINVDYAFVGHLMGAVALGAYVLAFNLASAPGLLLGNIINNVSMPAFSRVKHDPDLLKNAMATSLRAVSLILMPMSALLMTLARPLVLTLYGAKWIASAEVLSILSLYGAISIICVLFANMLTSLGKAKIILTVQLIWLGALVPAMALGVHRDGIVGAAMAHIAVILPLVLPSYLFVLKRATGVRLTTLAKAVLPPLLAALAAALAARVTAAQFADPVVQLITGLAAGGLIYAVVAAPQGAALLSQEQSAKLQRLRIFRFYDAAARVVRLPGSGAEQRGDIGRHRAGSTASTASTGRYGSATATPPLLLDRTLPLPVVGTLPLRLASGDTAAGDNEDAARMDRIAGLLRPQAQVVPFRPRPELGELRGWCRAPGHIAVRLVTGEGGAGKTRLATQLARDMEDDGWQVLWVPPGVEPGAVGAARRDGRPALLLVDEADARTTVVRLLTEVAADVDGPDLRVMLLARSAGDWWYELVIGTGSRVGDLLTAAPPIQLGPLARGTAQEEVFDAAVAEFAAKLNVTRPAATLTLSDPDAVVLVVHTAALSAVLDHIAPASGEQPRSSTKVLDSLLRREARYGAQAADARGLDLDAARQRRAVAAACLIGADSEPAAVRLLRRIPGLVETAEQRGQVARWLHDLYPGPATADRDVSEWLGSMRPDRAAEQLVVGELTNDPRLIDALFTGLDESSAKKALTTLGRAALHYSDAVPLLARALATDLEQLAIPALAVAVNTNPMIDGLIADTVAAQVLPAPALERMAAAIPRRSVALAKTAVAVLQRLADESSAGSAERASWLSDLSTCLADLGRQEEALDTIEEAVTIWRGLARARPGEYLPDLATSLNNRSLQKRDQEEPRDKRPPGN